MIIYRPLLGSGILLHSTSSIHGVVRISATALKYTDVRMPRKGRSP